MIRIITLVLCLLVADTHAAPLPATGTIELIFTPDGDAEGAIRHVLEQARSSIKMQAYLLTSRAIVYSLIDAKRRGIDVQVLADRTMVESGEYSLIPQLAANQIPVWLEVRYAIAHNKIIIVDAEQPSSETAAVITGSFNFTHSAQTKNAENLLILRGNPELLKRYAENWQRHKDDALPYIGQKTTQ